MPRLHSRRNFLATFGIGATALAVGCDGGSTPPASPAHPTTGPPADARAESTATNAPTRTPIPTPTPRPAGHETRALLPGTPWETAVSIRSTGNPGPVLVVLGGVHGNEPGGWFAADEIPAWQPATGVLAVLPRANRIAISGFLRNLEEDGDLNRQYPGEPDSELAMSRLAAQITALVRELGADVLLDLHESWAFYADREASGFVNREQAGTAFLGQTITAGPGPLSPGIATTLADVVNSSLGEREQLIPRDGAFLRRDDSAQPSNTRGRTSLSLGGHIPGLTPVLVEMGQEGQGIPRRTELHLAVVRATIEHLAM